MRFKIELSGGVDSVRSNALDLGSLSSEFENYLAGGILERYDYVCVTLTLASPEEIRGLNAQYRQIDEPTDVLSFPMWENDRAFAPPEGWSDLPLGDVIVSPEQVSQNALEHNIDYNTEMALVVIHGILHLIGLDHDTEERRLQMWAEQEEVLKNYFKRVEVI